MRLHARLGLRRSQDGDVAALQRAIRALTRREADDILMRIHERANTLWRPGSSDRASYWECLRAAFRDTLKESNFPNQQLVAAETHLYTLCERAGELFAVNRLEFNVLSRGLSVVGARRILARLKAARDAKAQMPSYVGKPEKDAVYWDFDSYQEDVLRQIAARDARIDQKTDIIPPADAWDDLSRRTRRLELVGRFADYHAGESLIRSAWELARNDRDAAVLLYTAGLLPHWLFPASSVRKRLLLSTPLHLERRLALSDAPQTTENVLKALENLAKFQAIAVLQDVTAHAVAYAEPSRQFDFGKAIIHQLQRDGVKFCGPVSEVGYEDVYPEEAETFQIEVLRRLFHRAGIPVLDGLDAQGVRDSVRSTLPVIAKCFRTLLMPKAPTDKSLETHIGRIFLTPYVRELKAAFTQAERTVPSLQYLAIQNVKPALAWTALMKQIGCEHLTDRKSRTNQRIAAVELLVRSPDGVATMLAERLHLDGLARRKSVEKDAVRRQIWTKLVHLLGRDDLLEKFGDEKARIEVRDAACALGNKTVTSLMRAAGLKRPRTSARFQEERAL
jgi:hypothetical protein